MTRLLNVCLPALAICFLTLNVSAQSYEARGKEMGRKIDQHVHANDKTGHNKNEKCKEVALDTKHSMEQKVHDYHVKSAERAQEKAEQEAYDLRVKAREAALAAKSAAQHTKEVAERSERVAEQKIHAFTEKANDEAQHAREAAKLKEWKAEKKAQELSEKAAEAEMRAQEAANHVEEVSHLRIVSNDG